jgi:hypothetical protein
MNPIQGEKFQDLCTTQISKLEHKSFELKDAISIDVDDFDFTDYDNSELVYCNSSLLNADKPKLIESKLYEKLEQLKNPFKLVLHNSDDNFNEEQLKYLNIPNCKKIYTQNMNIYHKDVLPLPIGIANSFWKWGNLDIFEGVLNTDIDIKSNFIYVNFTKTGGVRDENRLECYENVEKQNIPFVDNMEYEDYLNTLKTYKYCISPEGNGIDCYRTWESLYLKVVPICKRSVMVEYFSTIFPIFIVDTWDNLDINCLEKQYDSFNWDNWHLLDFETYCKWMGL